MSIDLFAAISTNLLDNSVTHSITHLLTHTITHSITFIVTLSLSLPLSLSRPPSLPPSLSLSLSLSLSISVSVSLPHFYISILSHPISFSLLLSLYHFHLLHAVSLLLLSTYFYLHWHVDNHWKQLICSNHQRMEAVAEIHASLPTSTMSQHPCPANAVFNGQYDTTLQGLKTLPQSNIFARLFVRLFRQKHLLRHNSFLVQMCCWVFMT